MKMRVMDLGESVGEMQAVAGNQWQEWVSLGDEVRTATATTGTKSPRHKLRCRGCLESAWKGCSHEVRPLLDTLSRDKRNV